MKQYYLQTKDEVLKEFKTSTDGLSTGQAKENLAKYGKNALVEGKKKTAFQVFLEQFKDLMVIILIIAAVISAFTGDLESTLVIIAVLILNAILGTVQHVKAEKSLESLKSLSSPSAKVLRNGEKIEIDSKDVVPGDIMLLEAGDMVTADGRILDNYSLQVNESSLTGESTNIDKADVDFDHEIPLGLEKILNRPGWLCSVNVLATFHPVCKRYNAFGEERWKSHSGMPTSWQWCLSDEK